MNGPLLIGKGDMVLIGRNLDILRILQEVVSTQIGNEVIVDTTDGTGGVGISHGLVFHGNAIIQLISVGLIIFLIEHRSQRPVPKESQIRYTQINLSTGGSGQRNVTLDVHTVLEGLIQVCLIILTEGNGNSDLGTLPCLDRELSILQAASGNFVNSQGRTFQNISFLSHSGQTAAGLGVADTLGHDIVTQFIGQLLVTKVFHSEAHGVDTLLIRVIAKLQLGGIHFLAVFVIGSDIRLGIQRCKQIGKAGALFPNSIRRSIGIERNIGGGHHQLVNHGANLYIVVCNAGEILRHILPQK